MPLPDLLQQNHFRRSHDGGLVFFPWSLRGQGYLLLDERKRPAIERVLRLVYGSVVLLATAAYVALESGMRPRDLDAQAWICAIAIALAPLLLYQLWLSREIYQLPPSDFRVSETELRERIAEQIHVWQVRGALVGSFVLGTICVAIAWLSPDGFWLGALGLVTFTITGIWMAHLLRIKREVEAARSLSGPGVHPPAILGG